ncbi:MAG: hypothetical protein HY037_02515 [Nitrospirae bacterium]|nr:hypothetical protein [Candidatus Troglogloeales bacterium]
MTNTQFKVVLLSVFMAQAMTVSLLWHWSQGTQPPVNTGPAEHEKIFRTMLKELNEMGNNIKSMDLSSRMEADVTHDVPNPPSNFKDTALLHEAVQKVLREELQPYLISKTNPIPLSTDTKNETPKLAASEEIKTVIDPNLRYRSMETATNVVNQAVSRGVWVEDDNLNIGGLVQNLSESQRIELAEKIHGAINRQELRLEGGMPLF